MHFSTPVCLSSREVSWQHLISNSKWSHRFYWLAGHWSPSYFHSGREVTGQFTNDTCRTIPQICINNTPKYVSQHFGFNRGVQQSHRKVSISFTQHQVNCFVLNWLPSEPIHPLSLKLVWDRGIAVLALGPGHLLLLIVTDVSQNDILRRRIEEMAGYLGGVISILDVSL